jgi:hypothetical protein
MMHRDKRGLRAVGIWSAWACGFGVVVGTACGSDDSTRAPRKERETAGAGAFADDAGGAAGSGVESTGGAGGSVSTGAAGGEGPSPGGAVGTGGVDAAGAAGAAGAPNEDCQSTGPAALQGWWTSTCNGYSCTTYVAASGALSNGCTNGQYESGTVEQSGAVDTLGEGGPFAAYSTKGTFTRTDCQSVTRDYIGQIPPNTGPEEQFSCELTRSTACAPILLEALAGAWEGDCGNDTCVTTFSVTGEMTSTCSNGQGSTGSVDETGAFSDTGGGGGFSDYSTTGVVALNADCDSLLMVYTWQMPPNQGNKTSSQCSYVRQEDE